MLADATTGVEVTAAPEAGTARAADPLGLARAFLDDARSGRPEGAVRAALAALDPINLAAALPDDPSRISFWLNVYNAAVRARLLAEPGALRRRWSFFSAPAVVVAGRPLSPNAIEHGILRRSACLLGPGYIRNPHPSAFERRMRVARVDPRIHFALNCGARSCPPLAAWDPATLDADLDRATAAYVASEGRRSADGRAVLVPRLFLWYRGDFGGRAGTVAILRRHGVIELSEVPRLRYADHDWTLDLGDAGR